MPVSTSMRHSGTQGFAVLGSTSATIVYTFDPAQVFTKGTRYVIDAWSRQTVDHDATVVTFGVDGVDEEAVTYQGVPGNDPPDLWEELGTGADGQTWSRSRVCWTPSTDRTGVRWQFHAEAFASGDYAVDDLVLSTTDNNELAGTSQEAAACDHGHWIELLPALEVDTSLVLAPDGADGVAWRPEADHALDDLTDVDTASTPPTDGQALVYDDASGLWVPGDVAAGGGGGTGSYAETIGDGTAASIQVTHGLATADIIVQLWDMSGTDPVLLAHDHADFPTSITVDDADNVTLVFGSAPATDEYRVVVLSGGSTIPSNELAYAQITANVSPTTTVTTVVTAGAITVDGSTTVIIEFYSPAVRAGLNANQNMTLILYDGASPLGNIGFRVSLGPNHPTHCVRRLTPSAGSHAYSIRAQMQASTGLILAGAGGAGNDVPAFIRVTRA